MMDTTLLSLDSALSRALAIPHPLAHVRIVQPSLNWGQDGHTILVNGNTFICF